MPKLAYTHDRARKMRPTYFSAASMGELAMPKVALKRHVIVDYGLQLGHVGINMIFLGSSCYANTFDYVECTIYFLLR